MDALRLAHLDTVIQSLALSAGPYTGRIFRLLTPLYANKADALSGGGSTRASGRFHVRGAFRIVYTGCTLRQAEWEHSHTARNSGIAREDTLPLESHQAGPVTEHLEHSRRDAYTSSRAARTQAGFEALLTPSLGPGSNLNILPQNLRAGSSMFIVNENSLPPPQTPLMKAGTSPGPTIRAKKRARP